MRGVRKVTGLHLKSIEKIKQLVWEKNRYVQLKEITTFSRNFKINRSICWIIILIFMNFYSTHANSFLHHKIIARIHTTAYVLKCTGILHELFNGHWTHFHLLCTVTNLYHKWNKFSDQWEWKGLILRKSQYFLNVI